MSIFNYILVALLFCIAGFAKSVADRIQWSDLFSHIPFLNRLKTGEKDKNQDGKITIREKYFPFDGWHLSEWLRILPFAIAVVLFIELPLSITGYSWLIKLLIALALTAIYNLVFILFYNLLPKFK